MPDGTPVEVGFFPRDDQFSQIFRSVCRRPPTKKELALVDGYTLNLTLSGRGGSKESAWRIMNAAATIVRAGGGGVFIDNSMLAHGGQFWLEMTEDGGMDALSFAFAGIVHAETDIYTLGMHVLGLRDIVLKQADIEDYYDIVDLIRAMVRDDARMENGHIRADVKGPCFRYTEEDDGAAKPGSAAHNPFGRYCLEKLPHPAGINREASLAVN